MARVAKELLSILQIPTRGAKAAAEGFADLMFTPMFYQAGLMRGAALGAGAGIAVGAGAGIPISLAIQKKRLRKKGLLEKQRKIEKDLQIKKLSSVRKQVIFEKLAILSFSRAPLLMKSTPATRTVAHKSSHWKKRIQEELRKWAKRPRLAV